jgi:hypothetical protein
MERPLAAKVLAAGAIGNVSATLARCLAGALVVLAGVPALAQGSADWRAAKSELQSLSQSTPEGCARTWEIVWRWAKQGEVEARTRLYWMVKSGWIKPPGLNQDSETTRRHAYTLLIHGMVDGDAAMLTAVQRMVTEERRMTQYSAGPFLECVDAQDRRACVDKLVERGLVADFDSYAREVDLLAAMPDARPPSCTPIVVAAPAVASVSRDDEAGWAAAENELGSISLDTAEGCAKAWETLWHWAKRDVPDARIGLYRVVSIGWIRPPGLTQDWETMQRHASTFLLHAMVGGHQSELEQVKRTVTLYRKMTSAAAQPYLDCVEASDRAACVSKLVGLGLVADFAAYARELDLLAAAPRARAADCPANAFHRRPR